ncbi:MAG TPA: hypothetical protein PKD90_19670, partial [Phnomibacter sp.]|nr:hypothetical protein [Phnomibacter sp.]
MTNTEYLKHTGYRNRRQRHQRHPEVRILMGLLLVTFGIFWLMRRMQVPLPPWLFGWEMLLIGFGLIMGIRNRLNDISWLIPIAIGVTFLLDDVIPGVRAKQFIWPILVIGVGLVLMLRAGFNKRNLPANEE